MSEDKKITLLSEVRRKKREEEERNNQNSAKEMVEGAESEPHPLEMLAERIRSEEMQVDELSKLLGTAIVEVLESINEDDIANNTFTEILENSNKLFNSVRNNEGELVQQPIIISEIISFQPEEVGEFDENIDPDKLRRDIVTLGKKNILHSNLEDTISNWFEDKAFEIFENSGVSHELDFHTKITQISVDPDSGEVSIYYTLDILLVRNMLSDMQE